MERLSDNATKCNNLNLIWKFILALQVHVTCVVCYRLWREPNREIYLNTWQTFLQLLYVIVLVCIL